MEDLKIIFARNLIMLRKQMKLTQIELAEKINYSDKAVSKWEREACCPDITLLPKLSEIIGCGLEELFTDGKI